MVFMMLASGIQRIFVRAAMQQQIFKIKFKEILNKYLTNMMLPTWQGQRIFARAALQQTTRGRQTVAKLYLMCWCLYNVAQTLWEKR